MTGLGHGPWCESQHLPAGDLTARPHTRLCGNCSRPVGDLPPGWRYCCWNPLGCDCIDASPATYPDGLRSKMAALRQLCADRQTPNRSGTATDAQAIWPSEILAILDARQLR